MKCYFFFFNSTRSPTFDVYRPDVSKILISVGFGFFLELTHLEAFSFIAKKVELLNKRVKAFEEESSQINADIKMMLNTLGQLQGLISPTKA